MLRHRFVESLSRFILAIALGVVSLSVACSQSSNPPASTERAASSSPTSRAAGSAMVKPDPEAIASINGDELLKHIKVLSSDEFEGRAPGTKGEELTVNYLTEQFKTLGLKPGNPDGTYVQKVPLAGFTPKPDLSFNVAGKKLTLDYSKDYIAR